MERPIYRYGETNLCYGVIFKLKFLSDPSTNNEIRISLRYDYCRYGE